MALTSRAKIKRAVGIPAGVTQHDGYIDDIVGGIDQMIFGHIGVPALTQNVYSETLDIEQSSHQIRLKNWPLVSVAAITESGSLVAVADYYEIEEGFVNLKTTGRNWTIGRQTVEITYTAGHADGTFSDVERVATKWAVGELNSDRHTLLAQEDMGTYKYKVAKDDLIMPKAVLQVLQRYMRSIFP